MKALGLIAFCLCSMAAPLTAQDTTRPQRPGPGYGPGPRAGMGYGHMYDMMPMMQEMMGPMMHVMAYTPQHLLALKDSLKLTGDQVTKLTTIQNSTRSGHDAAAAEAKTHMDAVSQAFKTAAPDTTALRPHFEAAHAAMGKAHWVMVAAAAQARAVLTDTQRQKVEAWVSTMQQRMPRTM